MVEVSLPLSSLVIMISNSHPTKLIPCALSRAESPLVSQDSFFSAFNKETIDGSGGSLNRITFPKILAKIFIVTRAYHKSDFKSRFFLLRDGI